MRVLLDQREYDMNATTVAEAVAAAAAVADQQGRIIVEVVVDGVPWTMEQLESQELARCASMANEVAMTTADPQSLVASMFEESAGALTDASALQVEAAELLQRDDRAAAMHKLNEAIGIWVSVQQAVSQGTELLNLSLDDLSVGNESAQEIILRLESQLQALLRQIEADDTVGLADTLLYELPDVVEAWHNLLLELQRRVPAAEQESHP